MEYEHLAFVATMQLLVNYACKREVKNAVGTYCGNKTGNSLNTERKVATRLP